MAQIKNITEVLKPEQFEFNKPYIFRLRQYRKRINPKPDEADFGGLWELCILDERGKVIEMISDADALNYCIENLQGRLEDAGF